MYCRLATLGALAAAALFALAACQNVAAPPSLSLPTPSPTPPASPLALASPSPAAPVMQPPVATPTRPPPSSPTGATARVSPTVTLGSTAVPTSQPAVTALPGTSIGGEPPYLDDRSDPVAVMLSYYNAINRKEYDRAYSYWESGALTGQLGSYQAFKQGFADTQSVLVTVGQVRSDRAAGRIYGFVPVALSTTQRDGSTSGDVGCFWLRLGDPELQDQPPFDPWAISSARIDQLPAGANPADRLAAVCTNQGTPVTPTPAPRPSDISASRYLDDRSTPEQVLHSTFNAINRREYDRAYSYWEPAAAELVPYDQFKAAYASTESLEVRLGKTTVGAAAGSLYFSVPTTLVAKTSDGQTQTYVGCYVLRLGQPGMQDQPPFEPLGIRSGSIAKVANDADTAALMEKACAFTG